MQELSGTKIEWELNKKNTKLHRLNPMKSSVLVLFNNMLWFESICLATVMCHLIVCCTYKQTMLLYI